VVDRVARACRKGRSPRADLLALAHGGIRVDQANATKDLEKEFAGAGAGLRASGVPGADGANFNTRDRHVSMPSCARRVVTYPLAG
jgi:hypothetical protein